MSKIVIRGDGPRTRIFVDDVEITHVLKFKLIGDGRDFPTRLILDVNGDDVQVEGIEATVEMQP